MRPKLNKKAGHLSYDRSLLEDLVVVGSLSVSRRSLPFPILIRILVRPFSSRAFPLSCYSVVQWRTENNSRRRSITKKTLKKEEKKYLKKGKRDEERKSALSRVMDDDLTTRPIYFLRVTHLDRARRPARHVPKNMRRSRRKKKKGHCARRSRVRVTLD